MNDKELSNPVLRVNFVEMLFALTAAEIAIQVADLVARGPALNLSVTAYAHLALALSVVTTSWVGWSTSKAPGNKINLEAVFSWAFIVLMFDVLLVVLYFILVKSVEMEKDILGKITIKPSAHSETLWIMTIFIGYAVWDIVTKLLVSDPDKERNCRERFGYFLERGHISLFCLLLSFLTWQFLSESQSSTEVLLTDVSLLSIVFLFRAMKQKSVVWQLATGILFSITFFLAISWSQR